jgi:hypothetical protein
MYRLAPGIKGDPARRWALGDRPFFACGACHVLCFAFLRRYPKAGAVALWFRPAEGFSGHHIVAATERWIFDYHGYSARPAFIAHTWRKARRWMPGWSATLVELPPPVLVSEAQSRRYDGLWLREPGQFLHDALPRAERFLDRFPPPPD